MDQDASQAITVDQDASQAVTMDQDASQAVTYGLHFITGHHFGSGRITVYYYRLRRATSTAKKADTKGSRIRGF